MLPEFCLTRSQARLVHPARFNTRFVHSRAVITGIPRKHVSV
jgi:hypothetical protein